MSTEAAPVADAPKPFAGVLKNIKANPLPAPGEPDNFKIEPLEPAPEPVKGGQKAPIQNEPVKEIPKEKEVQKSSQDSVFGTEKKPLEKVIEKPIQDEEKFLVGAPENMTPKAKASWIENRRENAALKQQLEERARQLEELGKKQNQEIHNPAELETLKAELETERKKATDYLEKLRMAKVEEDPEFIRDVTMPRQEIEERASAIAKKYELPEKQVLNALRESDDTRNDILEELTADFKTTDKLELIQLGMKYSGIERTANAKREAAKASKTSLESEKATALLQSSESYRSESSAKAEAFYNDLAKDISFLKGETGSQEWDTWIAQNRKGILSAPLDTPEEAGRIKALAAQAEPFRKGFEHMQGKFKEAEAEIAALTKRLARYEQVEPNNGGRNGEETPVEEDKPVGLGNIAKGLVGRFGGVAAGR